MYAFRLDASVTNIKPTFDDAVKLIETGKSGKRISVLNTTNCVCWLTWSGIGTAAPSSDLSVNRGQAMVPPGGIVIDMVDEGISNNCTIWVRGDEPTDITEGFIIGTYYN